MLSTANIPRSADILPDQLGDALFLWQIRVNVVLCRLLCHSRRLRRGFCIVRGNFCPIRRQRDRPIVCRIGHKDGRRRLIAGRADGGGIELDQQLPLFYRIALRHMRSKMHPPELHRIHADVDEDIHAICPVNPNGVLRLKEHSHLAVHGRNHTALRVGYRRTTPHCPACKGRIRHLRQRDQSSLQRTVQTNVLHIVSPLWKRRYIRHFLRPPRPMRISF